MFELKQEEYLFVEVLYSNESFVIVNNESFVLKILFLITYATRMYVICLSRFQHRHLGLDALLN
jgi:hypothetical protein